MDTLWVLLTPFVHGSPLGSTRDEGSEIFTFSAATAAAVNTRPLGLLSGRIIRPMQIG